MDREEEMTCRELVEVLSDYVDGTLPRAQAARLESHLADCPGCADYVAQFRRTIATLGRLGPEELTPAARGRLVAAFRGWRGT